MTSQPVEPEDDDDEVVEVARAHDRFEATIWTRHLEDLGMTVTLLKKGGWLRALLYLGRVPHAVCVPRRDQADAYAYLKKFRFI